MKKSWLRLLAYGKVVMIGEVPCRDCLNLPTEPPVTPIHLSTTPRYTCQHTQVQPSQYTCRPHSVTNNAMVECGKKTETRATDAAMPINGGTTRAGTSGDPLITRNPQQLTHLSQQPLQCLLHASVIYRGSFILDDYATALWMHTEAEGFTTH